MDLLTWLTHSGSCLTGDGADHHRRVRFEKSALVLSSHLALSNMSKDATLKHNHDSDIATLIGEHINPKHTDVDYGRHSVFLLAQVA